MQVFTFHLSATTLSFAWIEEYTLQYTDTIPMPSNLAAFLVPSIQEFFARYALPAPQAIACVRGPSSFTRLRLTLSAASGLALGWGATLLCLSSYDAILEGHMQEEEGLLLVAIDCGGGFGGVQQYHHQSPLGEPIYGKWEAIARALTASKPQDPGLCMPKETQYCVCGDGKNSLLGAIQACEGQNSTHIHLLPDPPCWAACIGKGIMARFPEEVLFLHQPIYGYAAITSKI